jgi:hypothetical protein
MKRFILFFLILLFFFPTISEAQIRIQTLGNSITQGRGSEPQTFSYRYDLWKALDSMKLNIDMVGSHSVGFNGTADYPDPNFDNDNEGHWGWKTMGKIP